MRTDPLEEPDEQANRVLAIFGEFLRLLIHKHRFPPEAVLKAAIGSAVMLYLEYNTDDERAAASYLRKFADDIEESAKGTSIN